MNTSLKSLFCCLLSLFLGAGRSGILYAAPQEEIGRAIAVTPHVLVERNGQQSELILKGPLYKTDILFSGASGKAQILLSDNTTVAIAPNTRIQISDFAYDDAGNNAHFSMQVTSGVSRVVTGMIVKKNPDAFEVVTPHATIGIRGTDCTIFVNKDSTRAIANHISTKNILVHNRISGQTSSIVTTGRAVECSSSGNIERPATPTERSEAIQATRRQGEPAATTVTVASASTSSSSSRNTVGTSANTNQVSKSSSTSTSSTSSKSSTSSNTSTSSKSSTSSTSSTGAMGRTSSDISRSLGNTALSKPDHTTSTVADAGSTLRTPAIERETTKDLLPKTPVTPTPPPKLDPTTPVTPKPDPTPPTPKPDPAPKPDPTPPTPTPDPDPVPPTPKPDPNPVPPNPVPPTPTPDPDPVPPNPVPPTPKPDPDPVPPTPTPDPGPVPPTPTPDPDPVPPTPTPDPDPVPPTPTPDPDPVPPNPVPPTPTPDPDPVPPTPTPDPDPVPPNPVPPTPTPDPDPVPPTPKPDPDPVPPNPVPPTPTPDPDPVPPTPKPDPDPVPPTPTPDPDPVPPTPTPDPDPVPPAPDPEPDPVPPLPDPDPILPPPSPPPVSLSGTFTGTLLFNTPSAQKSGNYQFTANLDTGTLSKVNMDLFASNARSGKQIFGAYNGAGRIVNRVFTADWANGKVFFGDSQTPHVGVMNGTFEEDGMPSITWAIANQGGNILHGGTGSDAIYTETGSSSTPPSVAFNPARGIYGSFSGKLFRPLTDGTPGTIPFGGFQFNVEVGTGEINDARMKVQHGDYRYSTYGGTGTISNTLDYSVTEWKEGIYSQSTQVTPPQTISGSASASLSGQFNEDGTLKKTDWTLTDNTGGALSISGTGNSFNRSESLSAPKSPTGMVSGLLLLTETGGIPSGSTIPYQFNIDLTSGTATGASVLYNNPSMPLLATGGSGTVSSTGAVNIATWNALSGYTGTPQMGGQLTSLTWAGVAEKDGAALNISGSDTNPVWMDAQLNPRAVSGTFSGNLNDGASGNFSFEVQLDSAQVTNANMQSTGWALSGGSGTINSGLGFTATHFVPSENAVDGSLSGVFNGSTHNSLINNAVFWKVNTLDGSALQGIGTVNQNGPGPR